MRCATLLGWLGRKGFVTARQDYGLPRPDIIPRQTLTMAAKNKRRKASSKTTKGGATQLAPKLSTREQDLLWHMAHDYQLETSSSWDDPILRRMKDNTELRATANRSTIEALQERGLIAVAKDGGVLNPTVWRLTSKASREVANDTGRT
jgi:hypothetical protein